MAALILAGCILALSLAPSAEAKVRRPPGQRGAVSHPGRSAAAPAPRAGIARSKGAGRRPAGLRAAPTRRGRRPAAARCAARTAAARAARAAV
jgi:hypothetical protein